MSNTALTGLTSEGRKQERLVLPSCVEKIEDHAFRDNQVLKVVYLSWSIKQIGLNAFDKRIIWKNLTFFYAPSPEITELLNAVGIPNSQICCHHPYEDLKTLKEGSLGKKWFVSDIFSQGGYQNNSVIS